jgi:hypothetical protein
MNGRLVWQVRQSKGPGKTFIDLPVRQLANGSYFIHVYDKLKLIGAAELLKL